MAKPDSLKARKLISLLEVLEKGTPEKRLESIQSLKVHGDETTIKPLVECLMKEDDDSVKKEIISLLNTTKSTKVPVEIIKCIENDAYQKVHQILLASIWNSGLDYTQYMEQIVACTIKGDLMHAIECITIIENIEGEFLETQIMEPIILLKKYLVEKKNSDDPKNEILKEILITLQTINDSL